MNTEIEKLADRMVRDGQKTLSYFRELSPEEWSAQVYRTGSQWTIRDILAHFVSAEKSFHRLVDDVVSGGPGAPRDLDIVEFNEEEVPKLDNLGPEKLLASFEEARERTAHRTRSLAPEDLAKVGYHPWFGAVEVRQMLKLVYRHNMIHLRDIRKALRTGAPVPHQEISPPSSTG